MLFTGSNYLSLCEADQITYGIISLSNLLLNQSSSLSLDLLQVQMPPLLITGITRMPPPITARLRIPSNTSIQLHLSTKQGKPIIAVDYRSNTTGAPIELHPTEIMTLITNCTLDRPQQELFRKFVLALLPQVCFGLTQSISFEKITVDNCLLRPLYEKTINQLYWKISTPNVPMPMTLPGRKIEEYGDGEAHTCARLWIG